MPQTNILTGMPSAIEREERRRQKESRDRKVVREAVELSAALRGEGGQRILGYIQGVLEDRINEFLKSDPECKAMMKLLGKFKWKLALGKAASEKIVTEHVGG